MKSYGRLLTMQYIIKHNGREVKRYQHKLQVWCYLLMNGYMWTGHGWYFKDPDVEIMEVIDA